MGVSGQRHAPAALYPRGKDPRYPYTHWIGGWVGPRAGLDAGARRKILCPAGDRTPIVQPVVRHYTDWATATSVLTGCCDIILKFVNNGVQLSAFGRSTFETPRQIFRTFFQFLKDDAHIEPQNRSQSQVRSLKMSILYHSISFSKEIVY
jgi:hypothetical protein